MSAHLILIPALFTISYVVSMLQIIETKNNGNPSLKHIRVRNETDVDVINNITTVNNALQELIKNYEQLKKIYKAASLESEKDYSTDSEIDERYKVEKHNKKIRSIKHATPKQPHVFAATQITGFDESEEVTHSESDEETQSEVSESDEVDVKKSVKKRIPKIQHLKAPPEPQKKVITYKFEESEYSNSKEKVPIGKETTKKTAEIIFINTHTKGSESKPKEPQSMYTTPSQKTRYKKVKHGGYLRTITENNNSILVSKKKHQAGDVDPDTKSVLWNQITDNHQKGEIILRAEIRKTGELPENSNIKGIIFVNNITKTQKDETYPKDTKPRRELGSNKFKTTTIEYQTTKVTGLNRKPKYIATNNQPNNISPKKEAFNSEANKKATYEKRIDAQLDQLDAAYRSDMEKTGDIIRDETPTKLRNTNSKIGPKNEDKRMEISDPESDEEEREINKEMFKTKILRKAYGDACSKVVVKKCHKACKSVLKRACAGSGCKSTFKSNFDRNARTGCIKEFTNHDNSTSGKRSTTTNIAINKDDFFAAACWPLLKPAERQALPKSLNDTSLLLDEQLNILRDRYEKACGKASAKRCNAACSYAVKESCKNDCPKRRKKNLKKYCRSECREAYKIEKQRKGSTSSSSTSSSSGDTEESDDDEP